MAAANDSVRIGGISFGWNCSRLILLDELEVHMKFESTTLPNIECGSVVDALEKLQVVEITEQPDGTFLFLDACDRWFGVNLTKEQVLALAAELVNMATKPQPT